MDGYLSTGTGRMAMEVQSWCLCSDVKQPLQACKLAGTSDVMSAMKMNMDKALDSVILNSGHMTKT